MKYTPAPIAKKIEGLGFLIIDKRMGEGFHRLVKIAPKGAQVVAADEITARHWREAFEQKRVGFADVTAAKS